MGDTVWVDRLRRWQLDRTGRGCVETHQGVSACISPARGFGLGACHAPEIRGRLAFAQHARVGRIDTRMAMRSDLMAITRTSAPTPGLNISRTPSRTRARTWGLVPPPGRRSSRVSPALSRTPRSKARGDAAQQEGAEVYRLHRVVQAGSRQGAVADVRRARCRGGPVGSQRPHPSAAGRRRSRRPPSASRTLSPSNSRCSRRTRRRRAPRRSGMRVAARPATRPTPLRL